MKWLEDKEEFVKLFIKLLNNYVSLYSKAVDYGSGEKISLSEIQVLERVMELDELRMSDLATELGYTKAAITKSVTKLEKKKLVEKYKKKSNKKEKIIKVTEYGIKVYNEYQQFVYKHLFKDLFQVIDESDDAFIENYEKCMFVIDGFYKAFRKKVSDSNN